MLPRLLALPLVAASLAFGALGAPAALAVPPVKSDPRLVKLVGTENTRTFATYRTTDGHSLNPRVLRSDNLSKLTNGDERKLARLGLATVIDLRTTVERQIQPDRSIPRTRHFDEDIFGLDLVEAVDLDSAYAYFVTDAGARAGFANTLRLVSRTLDRGRTALFHCSAGKDRTGWTAALLLTIAGVDRATVERDYLASNKFRHTSPADPLQGVRLSYLRTSFATANRVYGSFDGYLRKGLRLSDQEITALRDRLRA
ncbi:putative protein-tyrosine-phosphatase [Gordonia araii NBRC 100433]|uniref:Tyrosine specific protein phosphatases domain-containing protein n=2 Tax=Gordonia araii TaxID=263909 RepID=G7H0C8_9ACTN|nr:tyrosine-protein phosphatase [Gordonia araii NBRC 100433]GAB09303.1 putative protein-tyrosine-phosphatase [Gordonia araii NBRC 100433]